ncbi:MAG TPA: hypothetical protein VKP30_32975 [Polyangiaceae bacterium]|nr:hypothetical protein [Polyangiaceae bacterium]
MDLSLFQALPIGLLMFASLAWGYFRRRSRQRDAQLAFPDLAQRLGLVFRPASDPRQIGQLHGTLRGYAVTVDPDEQRKLIVRFRGEPRIDLRSYEGPRCPVGLKYYSSPNRALNKFFPTRFASDEMAQRLDRAHLDPLLEPFQRRYRHAVKQLNITQHGVTCVLDFGNPPHIPALAVEELLPALLDWAELIEPPEPS